MSTKDERPYQLYPPIKFPPVPAENRPESNSIDGWPPANWFGSGDADFVAPPLNFTLEDAYRWTDRIYRLYKDLQHCQGSVPSEYNDHNWSALTNTYELLDDLCRRKVLPIGEFRRYTKTTRRLLLEGEIQLLLEVREYLGQNLASAVLPATPPRSAAALSVDWKNEVARLGSNTCPVSREQALFLHVLIEAQGEWISLPDISAKIHAISGDPKPNHLERSRKRLPPALLDTIEVTSKGHRIKAQYLG